MNLNREIAVNLVRKYLEKQISKNQLINSFPDSSNDIRLKKILLEVNRLESQTNNIQHQNNNKEHISYLTELIQDIEFPILRPNFMWKLLYQLRMFNEDFKYEIENISIKLTEAAKDCEVTTSDMYPYGKFLIQNGYLESISQNPMIYRATDKLKELRTLEDVENMLNNAA
jgi:hypothetical protein